MVRHVATDRVVGKTAGKVEDRKTPPSSPIGIFDSGVGGLTVYREILRQLPHEDVVYLADTARVPYGGRPPEEIINFNEEIIPFLIDKHGVKLIIMACGTSSAIAYPVLKDRYKVELIGLIEPGSRAAVDASRSGRIGLIATAGTVNSGAYQQQIAAFKPESIVIAQACPLFVPLVESGFTETDEVRRVAKEYLKPLQLERIDTLLLGCTHYPHLARVLRERTGADVVFVDPAEAAVAEAKKLLEKAGTIRGQNSPPPKHEFLVTGSVIQFQEIGSRLLGKPVTHAKHVII